MVRGSIALITAFCQVEAILDLDDSCCIKEVMFQCITFKTNCITECYVFYFYLLYCFTFSVMHLLMSVSVIIFVHIRHICMHVLKILQSLFPWANNGCHRRERLPLFRKFKTDKILFLAKGLSQNPTGEYAWLHRGKSL